MAASANIYKRFEMYLLEACEPSRTQLRNVCLPLKALPSTRSVVCPLFDDNLYWGIIVLSSKRIHFCFITYLFVQKEPVKTLLYSATEGYTITSLASSGN